MSEEKLLASDKERIEEVTDTFATGTGAADDSADIKELFRWNEQCLAARLLYPIWNGLTSKKQKHYRYITTFSTQTGGNTGDFLNKLYMTEGAGGKDGFVNLTTFERAQLLWSFELFKVTYKTDPPIDKHKPGTALKYIHKADIPLIFEKMAMEDMKGGGKFKTQTRKGSETQNYFGRPQTGYGLKSFEWSYIGGDPATVRNDIQASMVLEFQDFNQLSKIRTHTQGAESIDYSLLDLLGYGPESPRQKEGNEDKYDPSMFEIKAVVGWNSFGPESDALSKKIKGQKTTLFLTLIDHDFSISQVGNFSLTLTYRARLEAEASQMHTNVIFAVGQLDYNNPDAEDDSAEELGLIQIDAKIAEAAEDCLSEQAQYWEDKRRTKAEVAKYKSWQNFFGKELLYKTWSNYENFHPTRIPQGDTLNKRGLNLTGGKYGLGSDGLPSLENKKIFKLNVQRNTIKGWLNGTLGQALLPTSEIKNISNEEMSIQKAITDELDDIAAGGTFDVADRKYNWQAGGGTEDSHTMYFFLLGDLLEIMTARALSGEHFLQTDISAGEFGTGDKIKIISGPLEFQVDRGASSKSKTNVSTVRCSLVDLPITVEAFSDFWYRNVIEQNRSVYNLLEFIRDIGDQLINKAFGEGCARALTGASLAGINGATRMKTGFLTLPGTADGKDPLLYLDAGVYDKVTGDILSDKLPNGITRPETSSKSAGDMYNYIVLYVDNIKKIDLNNGNEASDALRGIYHLKIHEGILQSIDFAKTDQPYLKESRQQLNKNPMAHLSNTYNVRASTVGNTIFRPGQMVYINPIGFGTSLGVPTNKNSISNVMGLGGYHIIVSVTNKISRDFTTQIVAQWDNNGGERRDPYSGISKCADKSD